jgi:hypothetical protein
MSTIYQLVTTSEEIENISDGLHVCWLDNHHVVAYVVSETGDTSNLWATTIRNVIETWPSSRPYMALYDLSSRGVGVWYSRKFAYENSLLGITKETSQAIKEIIEDRKLNCAIGLLFNDNFSGYVGQIRLNLRHSSALTRVEVQMFSHAETAVRWLRLKQLET